MLDVWSLIHQKPPKSKGRRSRSQGQMKFVHKNIKYMLQASSDSELRGQIFDRKLLNSRFAHVQWTCVSTSLLNAYHITKILPPPPVIGNRGCWTQWWRQFLDRRQYYRYFCACALKKSPNHWETYANRRVIALLWEIAVAGVKAGSDFWLEAPKQPFPLMEVLLFWFTCISQKAIVYFDCEN